MISSNSCGYAGGGVAACYESTPTINSCAIANNTSVHLFNGGGVFCWDNSDATITNCTIIGNKAGLGGGVAVFASSPMIRHCTILDNEEQGIFSETDSFPTVINSIVWGNINDQIIGYGAIVIYSNVQGGWIAEGNINIDPLFVGGGDYHLTTDSPCIDAGMDASVYIDIDGNTRPQGVGFDMGSDEYICTDGDGDGFYMEGGGCGEADCDDVSPDTHPNHTELCDNQDNDCDGVIPSDEVDVDEDGVMVCAGDCDDDDPTVHPDHHEICDFVDNNCDGEVDEGYDWDEDGWTSCNGDCDDSDSTIYPSALDPIGDGIDQNCDGCDGQCPPCFIGLVM